MDGLITRQAEHILADAQEVALDKIFLFSSVYLKPF